jgi:hypothetical protein
MNVIVVTTRCSEVRKAAVNFFESRGIYDTLMEDRLGTCLSQVEKLNIELISPRELLMTVIIMTIIDSEKRGKYFKKLIEWCKSIKEKQEGNPRWGLTRRGWPRSHLAYGSP